MRKLKASLIRYHTHKISARVWEWEGKGAWYFVTIEKSEADEIKMEWPWPRRGFGSIPVNVTLGNSNWKTSVFPEKGGTFLLPLKKTVRTAEKINKGDTVSFTFRVIS